MRGLIQSIAGASKPLEANTINAGASVVVFLWVTTEAESPEIKTLRHRIKFKGDEKAEGGAAERVLLGPEISVRSEKPIAVGPPLKGSGWLAGNGPSNISGHRRALIPIGGRAVIAQRFAIDWVQLHDEGLSRKGDMKDNKNYRCYGAEILAVADGVVADIKDGIPENVPGLNSRAVEITPETVGGNYVILDLGGGKYAFYAHLQPGSLRVKTGDRVSRGQVLGLVGNSGNSTEPHLHFHISDGVANLGSEGLPFVHESFEVLGSGWNYKAIATDNPPPVAHANEIPMANMVVRFPN
jgi:murein DD-endopeptidase